MHTPHHDLRPQLSHGDIPKLAQMTGFSNSYVEYVLAGKRKNPTLLEVIGEYVELNQRMAERISKLNLRQPRGPRSTTEGGV